MIGRITCAFRTLIGPWLALPLAALEVVNLVQRGAPWRGEALWTVDWMAIVLFVAGPLAAGFAATDAARLTRPGARHLVVISARPHRSFLRAALWCAGPLVAVHAVALSVALMVGGTIPGDLLRLDLFLAFLVQCAAFVWYAALGSLIGRFVTPVLAGLAGSAGGLLLFYGLSSGGNDTFDLLSVGGATLSRLGIQLHLGYLVTQLLLLLVTAATMLALPLAVRAGRVLPSRSGTAALAVALVAVAAAQVAGPVPRSELAAPEPPGLCYWTEPSVVCFYEQHARVADDVAAQLLQLVRAAERAGYDALVPERLEQRSRSYAPEGDDTRGFNVPSAALAGRAAPTDELIISMIVPEHCPALSGEGGMAPPEAYMETFGSALWTWMDLVGEEYVGLGGERILSPEEVDHVMAAWRRCELDTQV